MENVALATSQETWFRVHGVSGEKRDPAAWLLPSFNGRPRIVKPPLVTWLHLLAFSGLDPQTTPWYVYIFSRLPDAWDLLFYDYVTFNVEQRQPWYYYAGIFGLVFPWTTWSLAALISRPPDRATPGSPMRSPAWLWFWTLMVVISFSSSKQQRYILPAVAPLAIAIASAAATWQDNHDRLRGRSRRLLACNPWLVFVAAFVICLATTFTPQLEAAGILRAGDFSRVGAPLAAGIFLLASGASLLIRRLQGTGRYVPAALVTVAAASMLCTYGWYAYTHTDSARQVADNQRINRIIGRHPLYYLKLRPRDEWLIGHCEGFLFYVRRSCSPVSPRRVAGAHAPLYVMSFVETHAETILHRAGYRIVTKLSPQREYPAILWRRAPSTAAAGGAPARPQ